MAQKFGDMLAAALRQKSLQVGIAAKQRSGQGGVGAGGASPGQVAAEMRAGQVGSQMRRASTSGARVSKMGGAVSQEQTQAEIAALKRRTR